MMRRAPERQLHSLHSVGLGLRIAGAGVLLLALAPARPVSAQTQDVGEARESLPIGYTADPLEIGFNAEFLRDGLESIDADEVRFRLISPLRPAVLQTAESDFTYLIMPIRLAG